MFADNYKLNEPINQIFRKYNTFNILNEYPSRVIPLNSFSNWSTFLRSFLF